MVQYVVILTAGFFQGIRQNGQSVEGMDIVDGLGETWDRSVVPGQPGGIDGDGTERKGTEDIAEESTHVP